MGGTGTGWATAPSQNLAERLEEQRGKLVVLARHTSSVRRAFDEYATLGHAYINHHSFYTNEIDVLRKRRPKWGATRGELSIFSYQIEALEETRLPHEANLWERAALTARSIAGSLPNVDFNLVRNLPHTMKDILHEMPFERAEHPSLSNYLNDQIEALNKILDGPLFRREESQRTVSDYRKLLGQAYAGRFART